MSGHVKKLGNLARRVVKTVVDVFPQQPGGRSPEPRLVPETQEEFMDRARAWAYTRQTPNPDHAHDYDYFGD